MNKLSKIFLIYCILFSLFVTISGFIFNPKAIVSNLVFLPVSLYFLSFFFVILRKKNKAKLALVNLNKKKLIIVSIFFVILLAISIFNLLSKNSATNSPDQSFISTDQEQKDTSFHFGQLPTPTPAIEAKNELTINLSQGSNYVNIRKSATKSAEIIGKAYNNQKYNYREKQGGWYKIILPDEKDNPEFGWVSEDFVKL